jgi:hypothetical protein
MEAIVGRIALALFTIYLVNLGLYTFFALAVNSKSGCPLGEVEEHRLNMELDIQSLFRLHVHSCSHWLSPRNPPPPPRM